MAPTQIPEHTPPIPHARYPASQHRSSKANKTTATRPSQYRRGDNHEPGSSTLICGHYPLSSHHRTGVDKNNTSWPPSFGSSGSHAPPALSPLESPCGVDHAASCS
jgi:hypothetical protein